MNDWGALAATLKRRLPPVPSELLLEQQRRLLADPRARVRSQRSGRLVPVLVLCSAGLGALLFLFWPSSQALHETTRQLAAEQAPLQQLLGDGTRLSLARGARGTLRERGVNEARFTLERGTVSFDVVPRKAAPFTVVAGGYVVAVLGTRFSVSYEPSGALGVVVERGLVSVSELGREAILLAAGEEMRREGQRLDVRRATSAPREPATAAEPSLPAAPAASALEPHTASAIGSAPQLLALDWHGLYRKRDFTAALAVARQHGLARLADELGASRLADLADVARLGGDPAAALTVLHGLERRFPGTAEARQAKFLLGRVLTQLGRSSEAVAAFERYLQDDGSGTFSTEAMGRLLELYAKRGDTPRARQMAARYLERAPSGPYQALARSLTTDR